MSFNLESLEARCKRLETALRELIQNLPSECICHEAYKSRRLHDPQCWYCDIEHELELAKKALEDR